MKIIQLTVNPPNNELESTHLYGLSDDGNVYYYNRDAEQWQQVTRPLFTDINGVPHSTSRYDGK